MGWSASVRGPGAMGGVGQLRALALTRGIRRWQVVGPFAPLPEKRRTWFDADCRQGWGVLGRFGPWPSPVALTLASCWALRPSPWGEEDVVRRCLAVGMGRGGTLRGLALTREFRRRAGHRALRSSAGGEEDVVRHCLAAGMGHSGTLRGLALTRGFRRWQVVGRFAPLPGERRMVCTAACWQS
jgi:hypothetical protein